MIKVENTKVYNLDSALRGMRNPLQSWKDSDSIYCPGNCDFCELWFLGTKCVRQKGRFVLGEKDKTLAQKLISAGSDERKFLRQIFVTMDITAPLFWWKEMDTYKIGTVANSTSTMHKLASTPITEECFSFDSENETKIEALNDFKAIVIEVCEFLRSFYNKTKNPAYWRALIEFLPESWNQTRTWTANYEVLRNIYRARRNHKLKEWRDFCREITTLPCAEELILYGI